MENKRRRADSREFHIIYKTTCLITKRFYIGMHSTDNLDDGYKGSGKRLRLSINKHCEENHVTEILETLPNRKELVAREKEIVNEKFLEDPQCMNLMVGGEGGFISIEQQRNRSLSGGKAIKDKFKNDPVFYKKHSDRMKLSMKKNNIGKGNKSFTDKKHTKASKLKMSETRKGKGTGSSNSQFGSCWIYSTSLLKNKKIKKEELNKYIKEGWIKGMKTIYNKKR
jgi:hypothetical protein